jgi:hypothetical protein
MSWSPVEFAEEMWESVCHFIPKISSSVAQTIVAPSFWWCDKNSYKSRGMFSTEPIPSPMATPWRHFHQKIKPESPRSSAGVLSHNTPAVLHQIQAIFTKNCSSKSHLSLFQHGHPNGWLPTMGKSVTQQAISKPHLLMMIPSESMPQACLQACTPLKLSSCCK